MKYLQNYQEAAQTALLDECGAFFAFGQKQLDKQKEEGVKYVSMGAGLICPKDKAKKLSEGLERVYKNAISQDITENGMIGIIQRELGNHEYQITGNIEEILYTLSDYDFGEDAIIKEAGMYMERCIKDDIF